jgi:hypothetical protein
LLHELREDAQFLHRSKEWVVAATLRRVFRHDESEADVAMTSG